MSIVLYVCRLRRSLYRNIITYGTSLVDQWLRICLGSSTGKESACNVGDLGLIPGWEDPLEKGKATHSSILAQRIPWPEEPGRLQSMGLQRVGHNWATKHIRVQKTGLIADWGSRVPHALGQQIPPARTREGNGTPLQYSCLGNPMARGAWQATVHGVAVRHDLANKHACTHWILYLICMNFIV